MVYNGSVVLILYLYYGAREYFIIEAESFEGLCLLFIIFKKTLNKNIMSLLFDYVII